MSFLQGDQCPKNTLPQSRDNAMEDTDLIACSALNPNSKGVKQAVSENGGGGLELDVYLWNRLGLDLVEKIIARLPFKSLFQAPSLSKDWKHRFRCHAFQSEVQQSPIASSWKTYAPLFVNGKQHVVGYESSSRQWHRLPDHSQLADDRVHNWSLRAVAGSLFCWTSPDPGGDSIYVTNPLTKTWKLLPSRPKMDAPKLVHIVWEGDAAYKVILGTLETLTTPAEHVCIRVETFDSTDDSWTMTEYVERGPNRDYFGSAFVDGVLYLVVSEDWSRWRPRSEYKLISFDVKENMWVEIPLLHQLMQEYPRNPSRRFFYNLNSSHVVVCGSSVMLVLPCKSRGVLTLSVFRVDLEDGLAVEESIGPIEMFNGASNEGIVYTYSAVGQGDWIYIDHGRRPSYPLRMYNVRTQEWQWEKSAELSLHSLTGSGGEWSWKPVAYQPGLNPFFRVSPSRSTAILSA